MSFAAAIVVEVGDDFGDVLGMDLVEQLHDLVRALAHETHELRTDEARQAHGALYRFRAQTFSGLVDEKPARVRLDFEVQVIGVRGVEVRRQDEVEHAKICRFARNADDLAAWS